MTAKRPVGRPSKLNDETKKKLEQALIGCCSIEDACAYADICPTTYKAWMEKARADEEAGRASEYTAFMADITRAKAKAKPRLIMLLSKAAERDPRTTLAILERRYPKEWSARSVIETRDRTGEPEPKDEDVMPVVLEILDESPELKKKLIKKLGELK